MKNKKPYNHVTEDDLETLSSIVKDIDSKGIVKLRKDFSDTLVDIRNVVKNFFPKQLRFSISKDATTELLLAKITFYKWPEGFEPTSDEGAYLYTQLLEILEFVFKTRKWNKLYSLEIDISDKTFSGKFEFKRVV
jgi:hypothetical protein